jgi:hypothetical protein
MDGLDSLVEFVVSTSPNHCAVVGGRKTTGYSQGFLWDYAPSDQEQA